MFTWLARFIERHPNLHRLSLLAWRLFPPRLAGFLKGLLARKWLVGAVAVMIDESTCPWEVLLVEHSYRSKGTWGLPGGSLESTPGDPTRPRDDNLPDDVIESALRREFGRNSVSKLQCSVCSESTPYPMWPKNPDPIGSTFTFAVRRVTDLQHCDTALIAAKLNRARRR
jgi:hypothetical protein